MRLVTAPIANADKIAKENRQLHDHDAAAEPFVDVGGVGACVGSFAFARACFCAEVPVEVMLVSTEQATDVTLPIEPHQ